MRLLLGVYWLMVNYLITSFLSSRAFLIKKFRQRASGNSFNNRGKSLMVLAVVNWLPSCKESMLVSNLTRAKLLKFAQTTFFVFKIRYKSIKCRLVGFW